MAEQQLPKLPARGDGQKAATGHGSEGIIAMREEINRIFGLLEEGFHTHVRREEVSAWMWVAPQWAEPPGGSDYIGYDYRTVNSEHSLDARTTVACQLHKTKGGHGALSGLGVSMSVTREKDLSEYISVGEHKKLSETSPQDVAALHSALPTLVRLVREHFPAACRTL